MPPPRWGPYRRQERHRAGAKRAAAASEAARRFSIERKLAYSLWPD